MAPPRAPAPTPDAVALLLSGLIGRKLTTKPGKPWIPSTSAPAALGVYKHDAGDLAAIVMFDVPFAAHAAASLVLIPPGVANEAARSGKLVDSLLENTGEIFNICAQLFVSNNTDAPHVTLKTVVVCPPPVPKDLVPLLGKPSVRVDFEAQIPGYGGGRIAVLV
jgi:hypothetical protein